MPNTLQNGECCTPAGCMSIVDGITANDFQDAAECDVVKVLCNNEHCPTSGLMHRQCFDQWEASILHYLRSCGRARSWSERQRCQNLWTKKGYDLAFKVNLQFFVFLCMLLLLLLCVVRPAGVYVDVGICAKIANGRRNRWSMRQQQQQLAKMTNNKGINVQVANLPQPL